MLRQEEEIPTGWRLASLHDVSKYQDKAREAINLQWGICSLVDGKICGAGYKFEVEKGRYPDLGHKLITNSSIGKYCNVEHRMVSLFVIYIYLVANNM